MNRLSVSSLMKIADTYLVKRRVIAAYTAAGIALFLGCLPSSTRADNGGHPNVSVSLIGEVQRGTDFVALASAGQVKPGETIRWTITAKNGGSAPAQHYAVAGQVSAGTEYVTGTAQGDLTPAVSYS